MKSVRCDRMQASVSGTQVANPFAVFEPTK
jgi:hypothetical protein